MREPDALYQKGRRVASVQQPQVDESNKQVRFELISRCDDLMLADEFEFDKFILLARRSATPARRTAPNVPAFWER